MIIRIGVGTVEPDAWIDSERGPTYEEGSDA
jgi:hypothetical protein